MIEYYLWFYKCKISYEIKLYLLKKYKTIYDIFLNYKKDNNLNELIKDTMTITLNSEDYTAMAKYLKVNNYKVCAYNENLYPKRLYQMQDAPLILFYKGDIEAVSKVCNIGIVGSRNCTNYGKDVVNYILSNLPNDNVNIVSGMALGIDSEAHNLAYEKNIFTTAILGSGIDVVYPKNNIGLYKKIIDNGCVISQFYPKTSPYAYNFPTRNRIISGLSDVIIIVEGSVKSGTLITANAALDQGKEVFVVPGSIFSKESSGCNLLIKEGARPFTNIEDLSEFVNIAKQNCINKIDNKLNQKYLAIYNIVSDTPTHINDIINTVNVDSSILYELLFEMQLKEYIKCICGIYYVRNNLIIDNS